jgi:predicted nucleotidyltransferase
MDLYNELLTIVRSLDEGHVDYALVGGLAVAVWGAPRATKDVDLMILPEDLKRAKEALRPVGYVLEALPMTFRDGMTVHRLSKIEQDAVMTVDFLLVDANLERVWNSRAPRPIEGGQITVVSREELIAMKLSAGRPQDEADVMRLIEQDR